jgi:hypothetical protein
MVWRTCRSGYNSKSSVHSTLGLPGGNGFEVAHISSKGTRKKPPALTERFACGNHFGSIFRLKGSPGEKEGMGYWNFWIPDYFESLLEETHSLRSGMTDILKTVF